MVTLVTPLGMEMHAQEGLVIRNPVITCPFRAVIGPEGRNQVAGLLGLGEGRRGQA